MDGKMDKKFYGLIIPKKKEQLPYQKKSIFDSDSDDDAPPPMKPKFEATSVPNRSSRAAKAMEEKLMADDPTIYQYDDIYESLQEKKFGKQIEEKQKKQPRFINSLLKAADKRKKDQDRRQEKKIQLERTKEGDEFQDKEAFVTSAYKKKMEELQAEEDRERFKDQLDEMMDVTKQQDLSGFYRHYLNQIVGEEKVPEFGEGSSKIKLEDTGKKSTDKTKKTTNYRSRKRSESTSDDDNNSTPPRSEDEKPKSTGKRKPEDDAPIQLKSPKLEPMDNSQDDDDDDIVSDTESIDKPVEQEKAESLPKKSAKPDMRAKFIKRTVGTVFDAAQQRYFQRVAARGT